MNDEELLALPQAATVLHPDDVLIVKVRADVPLEQLHSLRTTLGGSPNRIVVFAADCELFVIPGGVTDSEVTP